MDLSSKVSGKHLALDLDLDVVFCSNEVHTSTMLHVLKFDVESSVNEVYCGCHLMLN